MHLATINREADSTTRSVARGFQGISNMQLIFFIMWRTVLLVLLPVADDHVAYATDQDLLDLVRRYKFRAFVRFEGSQQAERAQAKAAMLSPACAER